MWPMSGKHLHMAGWNKVSPSGTFFRPAVYGSFKFCGQLLDPIVHIYKTSTWSPFSDLRFDPRTGPDYSQVPQIFLAAAAGRALPRLSLLHDRRHNVKKVLFGSKS